MTVNGTEPFHSVQTFLAKQLQLPQTERLFLYCDSAFTPSPVEPLDHLFRCFGAGGKLNGVRQGVKMAGGRRRALPRRPAQAQGRAASS